NRQRDASGVGLLHVQNNDPTKFQLSPPSFVVLKLEKPPPDDPKQQRPLDNFDVDNAQSVVVTKDLKYAFVSGFALLSTQFSESRIPFSGAIPGGSNVGIIKDPFGLEGFAPGSFTNKPGKLVAATRPIPFGFPDNLVLSNDEKFLYVGYRGIGSVFVFDTEVMRKVIEKPDEFPHQVDRGEPGKEKPIGDILADIPI